jgi:hypothetical protein
MLEYVHDCANMKHVHICIAFKSTCCVSMMYVCTYAFMPHAKLIAFELAGEDRDRRENPVWSRFENCVFRVAQTWLNGIFPSPREFCGQLKRNQIYLSYSKSPARAHKTHAYETYIHTYIHTRQRPAQAQQVPRELVSQLTEMGFPEVKAIAALKNSGNEVMDAIAWLDEHADEPDEYCTHLCYVYICACVCVCVYIYIYIYIYIYTVEMK